jgi:ketosteroid isomerase-like protein
MSSTREVATRYMNLLCEQKFAEAFDMLTPTAAYRIIGTTPVSAPMKGRDQVKSVLVPALASCQKPPKLELQELIVEGQRAVALAAGRGVGPSGLPYEQPYYAMVMTVEGNQLTSVVEYADTVMVEVALLGKKLVPA